jgi:hypothetical protein
VLDISCVDIVLSRDAFCETPSLDPVGSLTGKLGIRKQRRHRVQYRSRPLPAGQE